MKNSIFALIFMSVLALPNAASTQPVSNATFWCVGEFKNNQIGGSHITPWTIEDNGRIYAEGHWEGTWTKREDGLLDVLSWTWQGNPNDGKDGAFIVQILGPKYFIAWRNGETFRWGTRTTRSSC
ncbi:hypothetical protein [Pannonibacter sp.]|uniref:hypothetical protein n=1 Tax=Pannonibacter sp. TaxID=1906786 RepID=UPI003F70D0E3